MNREALFHLWRVVKAAPDEGWDMSTFGHCGTVHCAAGWAAVDPWFQVNCPIPTRGMLWESMAIVFGLPEWQSDILFATLIEGEIAREVPKAAVIANIDRLLAGLDPIPYDA